MKTKLLVISALLLLSFPAISKAEDVTQAEHKMLKISLAKRNAEVRELQNNIKTLKNEIERLVFVLRKAGIEPSDPKAMVELTSDEVLQQLKTSSEWIKRRAIRNFKKLISKEAQRGNAKEILSLCTKILEIDPKNVEALKTIQLIRPVGPGKKNELAEEDIEEPKEIVLMIATHESTKIRVNGVSLKVAAGSVPATHRVKVKPGQFICANIENGGGRNWLWIKAHSVDGKVLFETNTKDWHEYTPLRT